MIYEVVMAEQATADLYGIYRYIAFNLMSKQSADGLIERISQKINALCKMPLRYRLYDKEPWKSRNLHMMSVDNYIVFYIPDAETRTVTVTRIMYGHRDIDSALSDN